MATEEELIAIRVKMRGASETKHDAGKVARAIDDIGDEAQEAARKLGLWQDEAGKWRNRAGQFASASDKAAAGVENLSGSSDRASRNVRKLNKNVLDARINLGPFSVKMKYAGLAIGGMVVVAEKASPVLLSAAEALATLGGGAAGAGGVGLLALGQASTVASLGLGNFMEALGGSEEAARSLSPEAYELYRALSDARSELEATAQAAMLPGLSRGGMAAMRNFGRLNNIVHATASELGDLAEDAGVMLGSDEWGRDLTKLGGTNVKIIGNLGDAALDLADALKDVLVEAAPLAEWVSEQARDGAELVSIWADGARKGGELRDFFQGAKTDLDHLGTSVGNVVGGIHNLFESDSVDGTGMLADLEAITQRFEDWTNSPAVQKDFGAAVTREIADGVAAASGAAAETLPLAAGAAAKLFWETFWTADPESKALIAVLTGAKIRGAIRGMTPLTPLYVQDVSGIPGGGPATGPGNKPGGKPSKMPWWAAPLGWIGGTMAGMEVAGQIIPGDDPAANIIRDGGSFAGKTPAGFRNTPAGQLTERVREVGEARSNPLHVPGPFEPIIETHTVIKLDGDVLTEHMDRSTAKRGARKR